MLNHRSSRIEHVEAQEVCTLRPECGLAMPVYNGENARTPPKFECHTRGRTFSLLRRRHNDYAKRDS